MTNETGAGTVDQLIADGARFSAVVAAGGDWQAASPCEGWTATDVLDHVIGSQREFLSQHVELGGEPQGPPGRRWAEHWAAVRGQLTAELVGTEYDGVFGRTTIGATLSTFYGMDLLVHRWDLSRALGQQADFTDDELDRLEQKLAEVGENIYKYGASKPALPVADDAPRRVAVLARIGRDAAAA